jgi:hypothetical protein
LFAVFFPHATLLKEKFIAHSACLLVTEFRRDAPRRCAHVAAIDLLEQRIMQTSMHFADALLSKLNDDVKLVGSSISCVPTNAVPELEGRVRSNPHLHGHLIATDQTGLQLLLDDAHVFACHQSETVNHFYADKGVSAIILEAGYNIDSFMVSSSTCLSEDALDATSTCCPFCLAPSLSISEMCLPALFNTMKLR